MTTRIDRELNVQKMLNDTLFSFSGQNCVTVYSTYFCFTFFVINKPLMILSYCIYTDHTHAENESNTMFHIKALDYDPVCKVRTITVRHKTEQDKVIKQQIRMNSFCLGNNCRMAVIELSMQYWKFFS